MSKYNKELQLAIQIVKDALKITEWFRREGYKTYSKEDHTPVTYADLASQILIVSRIKESYPDDKIIADAALEMEGVGWKEGVAELRVIISRPYQRKGLGIIMAGELYLLAQKEKVEELVVKMMKPQTGAQSIFHKLGFHHDITLSNYVKDLHGHKQDLVIMRCSLTELWQELEDYFYEKDMRHAVTHMF